LSETSVELSFVLPDGSFRTNLFKLIVSVLTPQSCGSVTIISAGVLKELGVSVFEVVVVVDFDVNFVVDFVSVVVVIVDVVVTVAFVGLTQICGGVCVGGEGGAVDGVGLVEDAVGLVIRVVKMAYPGYGKLFKKNEIFNKIIPNFEIISR